MYKTRDKSSFIDYSMKVASALAVRAVHAHEPTAHAADVHVCVRVGTGAADACAHCDMYCALFIF